MNESFQLVKYTVKKKKTSLMQKKAMLDLKMFSESYDLE